MKRRKRSRMYMPFSYKMMVPYLILVLLTDILVGYISYTMLIQSRTELAQTSIQTGMEQTRNTIQYQIDEIQRMSDTLFGSVPFQRAIQTNGERLDIYLAMLDEIVPQIQAPLKLFGNHVRMILYAMNTNLTYVPGDDLSQPIQRSDYYILPYENIENSSWYETFQKMKLDNSWVQIETDKELDNISHVRKLVSYSDYKTTIGYIRIMIRLDDLLGNFNAFPIEQGVVLQLQNKTTGASLYQRGQMLPDHHQDAYLKLHEDIPGTVFAIDTFVPYSYLKKDANRLQMVIIAVCSISFAVMAFIGYIVARLSGRKMARIVMLVRSFEEGNLQRRIRFTGNDEFVRIADAFNAMAENIQDLIKSVYIEGLQKKQAELEALQAQVNPHFLYNTLSTIGSLANLGETEKVTDMVKGLSRFYRLSLNQGKVYISLEKELEQVGTYLDIQRVKYADGFTVSVSVEPEILQVEVIKLILQPFVENIFKHAWFGDTIAITINGRRVGEAIELMIIDNGIGMRPETMKGLLSGPSQAGGYGLKNVDERIKLRYGPEFGIEIASIYGAGTAVRIRLPFSLPQEVRDEETALKIVE
ncbi:sensor histidine kinase [Gorillibacterium massiliense]|uniref:sensor histidine kinase n=1 Tax=Gorillibacterium massiliense TaxID=1280390 RepID=UPI0004B11F44|nr:histidine kinase [Gorillibacterium massiliense]